MNHTHHFIIDCNLIGHCKHCPETRDYNQPKPKLTKERKLSVLEFDYPIDTRYELHLVNLEEE